MTSRRFQPTDAAIQVALAELKGTIRARFPHAVFEVFEGDDPDGVYLMAEVNVEDTDEVAALYTDRLIDLQVEEGLPVYVLPVRPLARVAAELREEGALSEALRSS